MTGLLGKLSDKTSLSDTEQVIAKYIIENYRELINCSTRQLAKKTFTSSATIVRFSQKLGFEGYTDFKTKFLAEMMLHRAEPHDRFVTNRDGINLIIEKVTSIELNAIKETSERINQAQFVKAVNYLRSAEHIDFYAVDNNQSVANIAAECFITAGKYSTVHTTAKIQYMQARNTPKSHVAFLISRTGENRLLIDIAKILNEKSIRTITVTANQNSTIAELSTMIFSVASTDKMEELGPRVFLTGAKYVIDVLFALLMVQVDYEEMKRKSDWLDKIFYY